MSINKEAITQPKGNIRHKENLSASVLFTFTPKMEYMLDMLKSGIVPRYVYERLPGTKRYYITPMKCFCDIPLGKVKNHMGRYGYYGIGVKKSFLQKNGTTPVIYIHKNSEPYFGIKEMKGMRMEEAPFLPLLKRYYGDDYYFSEGNDEPQLKRIHFYDEREWRYIPKGFKPETSIKFETIKDGLRHAYELNKRQVNKNAKLKLPIDAIEYIIINKKKELAPTLKELRKSYRGQELDLILTKIIIAENIINDF
ncbi:MAG: abortive infection system antitoxin AbiGi family protein [Pseudomonadota bacterium]